LEGLCHLTAFSYEGPRCPSRSLGCFHGVPGGGGEDSPVDVLGNFRVEAKGVNGEIVAVMFQLSEEVGMIMEEEGVTE
jgi:hypothetical protein